MQKPSACMPQVLCVHSSAAAVASVAAAAAAQVCQQTACQQHLCTIMGSIYECWHLSD
jgi:hypothetical protein